MKSNYKNIDDANNKIDSIIKQFEICKEQIEKENEKLKSNINLKLAKNFELENENTKLKNDLIRAEGMEDYWKINSSELEEDLDNLRQDLQNRCNRCIELNDENEKLKSTQQELINDVRKYSCKFLDLKEENRTLREIKNVWLDSHRKVVQEKDKLSDELTSKIRHNHYQTLEINELKQELKEYRGF